MKTIQISKFKAFGERSFEANLCRNGDKKPRHLLIYGANGSGKTSIQEALKYAFFRLMDSNLEKVDPLLPQEDKDAIINTSRNKYRNKQQPDPFDVVIDGKSIFDASFNANQYNSFIITRSDISVQDSIIVQDILESLDYGRNDIGAFLGEWGDAIVEEVNKALKEHFYESLRIELDPSAKWKCTIHDEGHGLHSAQNLPLDFNEANLNLVVLLLITKSVGLLRKKGKDNILILDDFVTSLDAANRIAITKYVLQALTPGIQLIVLTHNVNYYNLFLHIINNTLCNEDDWEVMNLVHIAQRHDSYSTRGMLKSKSLLDAYEKVYDKNDKNKEYPDIGNKIRQSFEATLHRFAHVMMLGAVEDTKSIIERLEGYDTIYLHKSPKKNPQKIIAEFDKRLQVNPIHYACVIKKLRKEIGDLRVKCQIDIINVVRELHLYQKVVMHPMSHGHLGSVQWSDLEIRHSIDLLEKLESALDSINNGQF